MARPRILVVDDEPGMLRTIERILSTRYDVRAVRLPSAALDAADVGSFDVAILDVRMPEMDGFALMARLGELQPDLDVIMMTGSTDERDARLIRAIREKAFFFLTKPFDREVLLTLVQRCLEARRLTSENRAHVSRLECELRAAQVFQQSLLPDRTAALNGFEVAFLYEPCDELGPHDSRGEGQRHGDGDSLQHFGRPAGEQLVLEDLEMGDGEHHDRNRRSDGEPAILQDDSDDDGDDGHGADDDAQGAGATAHEACCAGDERHRRGQSTQ